MKDRITDFISDFIFLSKRRFHLVLLYILVFFFLLYVFHKLFSVIVFAFGGSVPYKIFLKSEGVPQLYDYLLVKTPVEDRFAKGRLIVKRVSCAPGMYLRIVSLDYYCCNTTQDVERNTCIYLGRAKLYSRNGTKITPYNPCGSEICLFKIPDEKYFLVNPHPDSYDSRYIGPAGKDMIISRLSPIW